MTHVLIYHGLDGAGLLVNIDGIYKLITMVSLSIIFSHMIYQSIEKPFIRLSANIIKMINNKALFVFNNN